MNSDEIKLQSKKLKTLAKKFGYDIKHSHALEILSNLNNGTHWHLSSLKIPYIMSTGIKKLDEDLMGGLYKGSLTTIFGSTNIGKSMFSISMICNIVRQKKKVLVYQLEGIRGETKLRILSNLSGVKYGRLINENLTEDENKKISKANKIMDEYLVIKEEMKFDYTVEDLTESIFGERINFKFDALFVDYGQLLATRNKNFSYKETMAKVFRQLKNIAQAYDCAVISPVQATRHSHKSNILEPSNISECIDICDLSDNILSLNMSDEERKLGKLRVFLEKQRHGVIKRIYEQKTSFDICNLISG